MNEEDQESIERRSARSYPFQDWARTRCCRCCRQPAARLPYLATDLGHRDINSTLAYITVTQDLLHQAGERFRTFWACCLQMNEAVSS